MRPVAILLALLLGGCSFLDKLAERSATSAPVSPSTAWNVSPAEELVSYLARLKSLNETALTAEAARQKQSLQKDSSDVARVKAAMAYTLSPQAEETEVLALVDPLVKKEARSEPEVRAMASFLQGIAHERRRLKESAAAAGARLRDAQRARDNEKQRAEALQERAAQLQQKLDALTDLEKSLSDRQTSPR